MAVDTRCGCGGRPETLSGVRDTGTGYLGTESYTEICLGPLLGNYSYIIPAVMSHDSIIEIT